MTDSGTWDIDRLAAQELLTRLNRDADPEALAVVAAQFARQRKVTLAWAAERAKAQILRMLEEQQMDYISRHGEEWAAGVGFAELQIASMSEEDLLGLPSDQERSAGQILRHMLRQARS